VSAGEPTADVLPGDVDPEAALWVGALVTFGLSDVATTHIGLQQEGVEEAHPLSEAVLGVGGTEGMVAVKAFAFAVAWVGYQKTPEEYRAGIPLGLLLLGLFIVANNARRPGPTDESEPRAWRSVTPSTTRPTSPRTSTHPI